ncbi:MAG: YfhO family protein [Candidatus Aminicenantes bacterium]|nr:YfhO family protein [Candidatus Aminicenantes bacterium]
MNRAKLYSRKDLLFFLLFLVLFLFVFKNFLFTNGIFFERDSTILEIPARHLCVQLMKEGNFALWTDAYGNGQPFLANPKNAVLYPSTWLYLLLPFFLAFKIHYVLHFILGWLGLYYLCKSYSLSEKASFLGATVFLFSGIFLSSLEFYNHVAALCWMPWILLVLHRYQKRFFPRLIVLAGFWSLLILAGTPYVVIITGCFALTQTLLLRSMRPKRLMMLALAVVLAFAITAVQLIPTIDLYRTSVREQGTSAVWSGQPLQLFNFVFPHVLGNDRQPGHHDYWGSYLFERGAPLYYSLFLGFGVFFLAFSGLKRPLDYRHYLFIFLSLFFFVLALGNRTPFYSLWKFLPPFSAIRYPVKYLVPFTFCLAMLSALGFDRLFKEKGRGERKNSSLVVFSAALLVLFFLIKSPLLEILSRFFVIDKASSVSELSDSLFGGLVLFFVCALLLFLSNYLFLRKNIVAWVFLIVVVFSLVSTNRFINPVVQNSILTKPLILEEKDEPIKIYREGNLPFAYKEEVGGTEGMYRYFWESLYPYYGLQFDVKYVFSRDSYNIYDKEMSAILASLESLSGENVVKLLRSAGCDFSLTHFPFPFLPSEEINVEGLKLFKQEITGKLPEAYLVYNLRKAETFEERMDIFQMPDFNPEVTAIVEKDLPLQGIQNGSEEDTVRTFERFQSKQRYQVLNTQPAVLVLQGNYRPGWKAWIDRAEAEVLKVNLSTRGVYLPAGTHELTLKYSPRSFYFGLVVSLVTLILILGTLAYYLLKRIFARFKSQKLDF